MLLFSTVLHISDKMTKDAFIKLVIDWNENSPHAENIVPNITWNGERNIRFGNDDLWLEIQEYRNENIIAVRYEKKDNEGMIWDTDYIMNFNEMKMTIQLDRSFYDSTLIENNRFSAPYFISLLIRNGYVIDDEDLKISEHPITVSENEIPIISNIINGKSHYELPVVYISKTIDNTDPIDTNMLAKKLKGIAHVLVEEGTFIGRKLKYQCSFKNEYYGAIGIYYPNNSSAHKKLLYREYEGYGMILLNKTINAVLRYSNSMMLESLYTWDGVSKALLNDRLNAQRQEKLKAEIDRERAKQENSDLWDTFGEELSSKDDIIKKLSGENDRLHYEISQLRQKLSSLDKVPILYYGQEEDFYQDEIKEIILDIIDELLKKTYKPKTRRAHILKDILDANGYKSLSQSRKESIKNIFQGYKTLSGEKKQRLKELGFTITEDGKHYKLTYYGDARYLTTVSKTASDVREGKNIALTIEREML